MDRHIVTEGSCAISTTVLKQTSCWAAEEASDGQSCMPPGNLVNLVDQLALGQFALDTRNIEKQS